MRLWVVMRQAVRQERVDSPRLMGRSMENVEVSAPQNTPSGFPEEELMSTLGLKEGRSEGKG